MTQKSLIFFFDGTCNYSQNFISKDNPAYSTNKGGGTNVWKMRCMVDERHHECYYVGGVGNTFENTPLGWFFGSAFGAGVNGYAKYQFDILKDALKKTINGQPRYAKDINVIGFSRGSASAIQFAHLVDEYNKSVAAPLRIKINFMGLFDTVFSAGMPFGRHDMSLEHFLPKSLSITCFRHAVAAHEMRDAYSAVYQTQHSKISSFTQETFKGDHSDIGGGWAQTGLSDITLEWMLLESIGLKYRGHNYADALFDLHNFNDVKTQAPFAPDINQLPHRCGGLTAVWDGAISPRKFTTELWDTFIDKEFFPIIKWRKATLKKRKGGPKHQVNKKYAPSALIPCYDYISNDALKIDTDNISPNLNFYTVKSPLTKAQLKALSIIDALES